MESSSPMARSSLLIDLIPELSYPSLTGPSRGESANEKVAEPAAAADALARAAEPQDVRRTEALSNFT